MKLRQRRKSLHLDGHADYELPLLPVQLQLHCEGEFADFSSLSRLSILTQQHGIPDSGNLFCKMLRTYNEEMKHGGTMTDHGQREP